MVSQFVLLYFFWLTPQSQLTTSNIKDLKTLDNLPVHYSFFSERDFFDDAYSQAESEKVLPKAKVIGGIIPHHLIVKDKIAAFFEGLEKFDYQTVILIGPNHYNGGADNIITSRAVWATPYGALEPKLEMQKKISNLRVEEEPFIVEHSISGLVSFIKKSLPQAKFIPIIIKDNTPLVELKKLAQLLDENVNPTNTLVLTSVDFSHYQPLDVASFHDQKSIAAIENFDFDSLRALDTCSGPSLYVLLKYLEFQQAEKSDLLFSTNSGALLGNADLPTTSHNIFYFYQGQKKESSVANFLFFGDIMLDRNVKEIVKAKSFDYLLKDLAGEEKRFFRGIDIVVANLEGAVTNNGSHYPPELTNDFAFDPATVKNLSRYNFNFFNIANNHLTDQGVKGVTETAKNLSELNFNFSGCSDGSVDDCSSKIVSVRDLKIAMVGFSMVYNQIDLNKATQLLRKLSSENDAVIVSIHWGQEYQAQFNERQQKIAHELIDSGADVIIGSHPHVIQGVEIYKDKPIFYSLGNFIFDQYFSAETQRGLAIGLTFNKNPEEKNSWRISYFPFEVVNGKISLTAESNKTKLLNEILLSTAAVN